MKVHGDRELGALSLPVILVLVAAAVILVLVLSLRGGDEEAASSSARQAEAVRSPEVQRPSQSAPIDAVPSPSRELAAEERETSERFRQPSRAASREQRARETYRAPPDESDVLRRDPSEEIPREFAEALENPPEMPESLRRAIERGEINEIPPEYQAAIDGPRPQISAELLERLERQATERDIPAQYLGPIEDAKRRMNAGRP